MQDTLPSPLQAQLSFWYPVTPDFLSVSPIHQLLRTSEDVAKMQEELEMMRPLLEEAAKDTVLTMEQIKVSYAPGPSSLMSDHV